MKKLLWIGDAGCPSGFARVTHETLNVLHHHFDVTVMGINYRGDPYNYPYPIYAAGAEGDGNGINRLIWMCDLVKPDVIVIQQDPWNLPAYVERLRHFKEYAKVPVVASVPIDGKNVNGKWLDGISLAIFWTQFGLNEARMGGYRGPATVIPLGVDLDMYYPIDKYEARSRRLPKELDDAFIVGSVNRNQSRKRWDLTVKYFVEWVTSHNIDDAYLYLHTAPTGDTGIDVKQLMKYYGLYKRLALLEPPVWYGVPEHEMRDTYNCFDVFVSTTQGEGFGLTALEAMACGVPCILPDWSALGDWAKDSAQLIPCTSTLIGPPFVNILGGIADERLFVEALHSTYVNVQQRKENSICAFACARQPQFRWEAIGNAFLDAIKIDTPEEVAV